jgi:hypothetical protein
MKIVSQRLGFALATMTATAALLLGSVPVHAQDASSLDGKWTVKWVSRRKGNTTEATLELNGSSGKFKQLVQRGKPGPCLAVTAPVSAEKSGDELLVTAKYSEVVKGCSDRAIKFKKVSDRDLEGVFSKNGVQVTAVKE